MENEIKSAYQKIESVYAGSGKKFILHLIASFLPINEMNRYISSDKKCAITNKKGFNIDVYGELTFDSLIFKAKMLAGDEAVKKHQEMIEKVRDYFEIEEGEDILQTRQMYYSESSDKVLSTPALVALRNFAFNKILIDRDISRVLNQKRFSQHPKVSNKEAQVAAMKSVGYTLSDGNEKIFEELKKKFGK